jgi:biofilm PGA synthesis lipoprotein PgaB
MNQFPNFKNSARILTLCFLLSGSFAHAAVVLQYHHMGDDTPAITSTSVEAFEAHLEHIANSDLIVVPLTEIVEQPFIANDKRIAITFDDAYANIFELGVPRLVARGWPFTVFVATEYLGLRDYFSWDDLRYIENHKGLVANHTHSHLHMLRKLPDESKDEWLKRLRLDIERAQTMLAANLKHPAKYLAYPYGEYDLDILQLISDMGYVGFGQQSGAIGKSSLMALLPRYPLSGSYADLESFKTKVMTQALPIDIQAISPLIKTNPPNLTLRFHANPDLRLEQLACYGPGGKTLLEQKSPTLFIASNQTPLGVGRSRYNCTMPIAGGAFYWFSQLWIRKNPDGSWYPEH